MSLPTRVREYWRSLKRGRPGHRFQDRFDRSAEARKRQSLAWRIGKIVAGVTAIVIGVVELVFPGPAVLFFLVGGTLLATQSRAIARAMDWLELRGRAAWGFVRRKARAGSHHPAVIFVTASAAVLAAMAADPAICA